MALGQLVARLPGLVATLEELCYEIVYISVITVYVFLFLFLFL